MSDTKEKIGLPDTMVSKRQNGGSDEVIGQYKHEVNDQREHGIKGDKTGISTVLTFVVALAWALFQLSTASWLLLDSL